LFFEVRILAARHFVEIHFRCAGLRTAVKGKIIVADNFPVIGAFIESVEIDSGIPVGVLQGGNQGIEIGLTGRATHRGDGGIDDIDSCFTRL
jgi:hypothetical protein